MFYSFQMVKLWFDEAVRDGFNIGRSHRDRPTDAPSVPLSKFMNAFLQPLSFGSPLTCYYSVFQFKGVKHVYSPVIINVGSLCFVF